MDWIKGVCTVSDSFHHRRFVKRELDQQLVFQVAYHDHRLVFVLVLYIVHWRTVLLKSTSLAG